MGTPPQREAGLCGRTPQQPIPLEKNDAHYKAIGKFLVRFHSGKLVQVKSGLTMPEHRRTISDGGLTTCFLSDFLVGAAADVFLPSLLIVQALRATKRPATKPRDRAQP